MKNRSLFIGSLLLCGVFSFAFNQTLVTAVNAAFGISGPVAAADQTDQYGIRTPATFIDVTAKDLVGIDSLSDGEKDAVIQRIPATINYEFRNRGPHENIYDFSVFSNKKKDGGILFVGDSTIAWGFSIRHFSEMAETEVHALTFGRNIMDDALLQATERIIECYYTKLPTVMVSHFLRSMSTPIRLSRVQDQAIVDISRTSDCKQLYKLVSQNRKKEKLAPPSRQREKKYFQPAVSWNFRDYRAAIASIEPEMGHLAHVKLHEIMEPGRFEEMRSSDWSFYRWQPEYRIPFRHDDKYDLWHPASQESERTNLLKYIEEHEDRIEMAASKHRSWAKRNVCFVLPLTRSAESGIGKLFFPGDSVCRIDFEAIAATDYPSLAIKMHSDHHFASSGGIVFAALAGKYVRSRRFPTWQ